MDDLHVELSFFEELFSLHAYAMIGVQSWLIRDELRNNSTRPISNNLRSLNYCLVFHDEGMRYGTSRSACLRMGPLARLRIRSMPWSYLLFLMMVEEQRQ